ncbi:UNVERIFIED_CONTAM: hypothetical protein Sradi_4413700 [Sesamum radiatum]|uniref:Integrase catalytic domain-containing protein n=1 Tax=Sesamum radiatum TaxID=300843 RepID=A0AAW2NQL4_SESRA
MTKSSGGHLYILAATDYFSKWAEAVPLKEVKKENVADFIRINIITDNGKSCNSLIDKLCQKFGFKQRNSSMYYAAANGLAEAFNKTLCSPLKKVVAKSKRDWHERTGKKLHGLNATQIMLKKKGHAIQDSRRGLGFTPPKPVRIAIGRVISNYVVEGFSSTKDDKGKENPRESVFNRLGPHRKALHGIANKQSVFDRLGPLQRMVYQKKGIFKVTTHSKKKIKSLHTQRLRNLIPSKMRRQTTLAISCGEVLKVKAQTMIFTQVQSDDEDDRESVASSNYISNCAEEDIVQTYQVTLIEDGEIEEEDAEDAPVKLEEGVKATVDELKEVNLGNTGDPRPIYTSASLTQEEEDAYIKLLHEFKDVFAWSYKEMPGLDPKVAVHHLIVKKRSSPCQTRPT